MGDSQGIDMGKSVVDWHRNIAREIESLRQQVQDLKAENERLRNFRSAVCGWRERDWSVWFCRKTAEAIADFGREKEQTP